MASIKHLWMVLDPESEATRPTVADLCWKQDMSKLAQQIFGGGSPMYWKGLNLKFYTDKGEAMADAAKRLAAWRRKTAGAY